MSERSLIKREALSQGPGFEYGIRYVLRYWSTRLTNGSRRAFLGRVLAWIVFMSDKQEYAQLWEQTV